MSEAPADPTAALPLHRGEALTDGIYAVAMTLLVIELKLPDAGQLRDSEAFMLALLALVPKVVAWVISFFVLALFWLAHHRVFAYLRHVDSTLMVLNLLQLAFVSLMPFSSALVGDAAQAPVVGQAVYSINMAMLAVCALLMSRHVHRHPELTRAVLPRARYLGAGVRLGGIVLISVVAIGLTALWRRPGIGNMAFMLMAVINPASRAVERRQLARPGG